MGLPEADRSLRSTALWKLLERKAEAEQFPPEFIVGVGAVCARGITCSKDIIASFPTFTLHDIVHICNVCDWMYRLLGSHAEEITAVDAALLVMSAACHDLGMCVSEDQKEELAEAAKRRSAEWEDYFSSHEEDDEKFQRTGEISPGMLRNFVRLHHHERAGLYLHSAEDWPDALMAEGISGDMLLRLCKSHGEPLGALSLSAVDERSSRYHLLPCAVLLRLADILDFDASRAPRDLYDLLGLNRPRDDEAALSQTEWNKNCTNHHFELADDVILFQADCTSMQIEHQVRSYMAWLQTELDECGQRLIGRLPCWGGFQPPYKVEVEIRPNGYKSGPFCITMEQDRILELLVGRHLYSDPGVFVRELLQNAIDAVQTRAAQDSSFRLEDGRIVIHTWMEENSGCSWFRIEDNGTGMDEDIILNHFLKVGSSYYNSARFKMESRRSKTGKQYTPISRFGIGILSCFMSDPEHNKLQLSTRRFAQPGSLAPPAIRMNVNGLYGYYYLAEEGAQAKESTLLTMAHPPGEQDWPNQYRGEAGTTICVQVKLYQMGGLNTLKELVDRYVQFPKVRVEYHGEEGDFIYPTQWELMEAVHSLNPDGEGSPPKKHCHYISDENFAKLKVAHPEIIWGKGERPGISLEYCPLDWLAPGDQVSGVAVLAKPIKPQGCVIWKWPEVERTVRFGLSYDARSQQLRLTVSSSFSRTFDQEMEELRRTLPESESLTETLLKEYPEYYESYSWHRDIAELYGIREEDIPRLYDEAEEKREENREAREKLGAYQKAVTGFDISFPYTKLAAKPPPLNAFPDLLRKTGQDSAASKTVVAFNGILADHAPLLGNSDQFVGGILLLQENYRPEVNLARDTISALPLEAVAVLDILQRKLRLGFGYKGVPDVLRPERFLLRTERELQAVLENRPILEDELRLGDYTPRDGERRLEAGKPVQLGDVRKDSIYDMLSLASAKRQGTVRRRIGRGGSPMLYGGASGSVTADFPATLFFAPERDGEPFGHITGHYLNYANYYNQEHPFSRWLIAHRGELMREAPGIYNALLEGMLTATDQDKLREDLNRGLKRLQSIPGNPHRVTDDLFLRESDFV